MEIQNCFLPTNEFSSGMETWLKDLEIIENRYCSAVEGTEEYTIDEHIAFLEELNSDEFDDSDEELNESICYGIDLQEQEEYEARMVEILRCFRKAYEAKSRLMRESCILTCDAVESENEPRNNLDVIEAIDQACVGNESEKSITLSDWYISLTSQFSVVLIGRREDSGDVWQTTAIKERVKENPTKLRTFSDSLYILEGEIDQRSMQQSYFPDSIIKHFCHGFPENWQAIIQTYGLQFGVRDRGLLKEHVYLKRKEEYSALFENCKTDKPKLGVFSDLLKSHFPANKCSLPNKRDRSEAMSDILEVVGGAKSFSCKLPTDSCQSCDSCERSKNGSRARMRQRQDGRKCLVESLKSFSKKEGSNEDKTYTHDAGMELRNKGCWRERANGGKKDLKAEDLIEKTCMDESSERKKATGYFNTPCTNIQLIKSDQTPKLEKINNKCFSTIKVQRRRRVPRMHKGKTQKGGYVPLESAHHRSLIGLEKNNSFQIVKTCHRYESEDAVNPDHGGIKEDVVVSGLHSSSDAENGLETDMKRLSSRYNFRKGDYLKINNSSLLGNENLSRMLGNGSGSRSFDVERREVSIRDAGRDQRVIKESSSQNKINQRTVKVLRPEMRFYDDWDKDIHFGSDEDTDLDSPEPQLHRVYPLRSRTQSGAASTSETENADCLQNNCCRNGEIENHEHGSSYDCSKTVESKGMGESSKNKKKVKQMSKRLVENTERERRKEKLEVIEGFGSDDWNEQEIEKLQFAMCSFRPETQHCWQKVSCFMGTKSPFACQRKYEQLVYPAEKKKQGRHNQALGLMTKQNSADGRFEFENVNFNDVVTAKRGTLRRKQQLRELLDAYDRDYEDNIFNSTPYRKRQRTIKLPFDVTDISGLNVTAGDNNDDDNDDDDINSSSCTESSNSSMFSSSSNFYKTNVLLPTCRDPADAYLHKLQKLRKTRAKHVTNRPPAQALATAQERSNNGNGVGMHNLRNPSVAFRFEDAHNLDDCDADDSSADDHDDDDEYFDEDI